MYSYMKIFANNIHLTYHITYYHIYIIHIYYTGENKKWYQKQSVYLKEGKAKSYTTGHTD